VDSVGWTGLAKTPRCPRTPCLRLLFDWPILTRVPPTLHQPETAGKYRRFHCQLRYLINCQALGFLSSGKCTRRRKCVALNQYGIVRLQVRTPTQDTVCSSPPHQSTRTTRSHVKPVGLSSGNTISGHACFLRGHSTRRRQMMRVRTYLPSKVPWFSALNSGKKSVRLNPRRFYGGSRFPN